MTPSRLLIMCIIGAIFLNCSNYIFMMFHGNGQRIAHYYYPKTASGVEVERSRVHADSVPCDPDIGSAMEVATSVNTSSPLYTVDYNSVTGIDEKQYCKDLPSGLGPVSVFDSKMSIQEFEAKYGVLNFGGFYQPKNCVPRQRVAVIIAYRGCRRYLAMFLFVLHPILIKQQVDYQVFVVEQSNSTQIFNRGKLLNIGFREALKHRAWNCIIFHEAHIVPTDSRNLYRCSWYPRQLATLVERPNKFPYVPKFGGAVAMTSEQFETVNGFSNKYWGNDADYEDLYNRVFVANYFVENSIAMLGKYKTLKKYSGAERIKSEYMQTVSPLYLLDGLSSLTYKVEAYESRRMYTYIKVDIGEADPTEETPEPRKQVNSTVSDKVLNITVLSTQMPATTIMMNKQVI